MEQAVELFNFPQDLGKFKEDNIIIKKGMYGYYISYGDKKFPITDQNLTFDEAVNIIEAKQQNILKEFKDGGNTYTLLNGKYGVYLSVYNSRTKKYKNVPFPKKINMDIIDLDYIKLLVESNKEYKKNSPKKEPVESTPKKVATAPTKSVVTGKGRGKGRGKNKKPDADYAF